MNAARYRELFDKTDDGVWAADTAGPIVYVNPRLASMLGCGPDEIVGHVFTDFVEPADRAVFVAGHDQRPNGHTALHHVHCRRNGAAPFQAIVGVIPRVDDAGHVHGTLGVVIDVTDRRRAEVTAAREAASLASVASLAAAAAHEINNPLTVIVGTLELLLHRNLEPDVAARLERAVTAAFDVQDIVRRMQHVTRVSLYVKQPNVPEMLDLFASSGEAG